MSTVKYPFEFILSFKRFTVEDPNLNNIFNSINLDFATSTDYLQNRSKKINIIPTKKAVRQKKIKVYNAADLLRKKINIHLNKLATTNFETVSAKIADITIDNLESLDIFVTLVFNKIIEEHTYSSVYGDLIKLLCKKSCKFMRGDRYVDFRDLLVEKTQAAFEYAIVNKKTVSDNPDIHKKHIIGYIYLICELFRHNIISHKIVHSCISYMMINISDFHIELVCKLLHRIGSNISAQDRATFKFYIDSLKANVKNTRLEPRTRFMITDTVEECELINIKCGDVKSEHVNAANVSSVSNVSSIASVSSAQSVSSVYVAPMKQLYANVVKPIVTNTHVQSVSNASSVSSVSHVQIPIQHINGSSDTERTEHTAQPYRYQTPKNRSKWKSGRHVNTNARHNSNHHKPTVTVQNKKNVIHQTANRYNIDIEPKKEIVQIPQCNIISNVKPAEQDKLGEMGEPGELSERLMLKVRDMTDEYLNNKNIKETVVYFNEFDKMRHPFILLKMVEYMYDAKTDKTKDIITLIEYLIINNHFQSATITKSIEEIFKNIQDVYIDAPNCITQLCILLNKLLTAKIVDIQFIKQLSIKYLDELEELFTREMG
ncbi:MAG: eukaryotic translation initiation factor 4G-like [Faunusvirus sp.]|jgi:hypothetical protein|uniref:Eukaryotic translation initiation factor 4G-like n=1 Tax=Faunusvirus sp. TaxID=2487766 RepID=A0A3G4ZWE5_9VIRU|nr:MAG: eukaryotic translation initiation factor 4G-like [Faunusvirus sp.]